MGPIHLLEKEKYMYKIIYKDENILENRTMEKTGNHMKMVKSTKTNIMDKVQKTIKFGRLLSLISYIVFFTMLLHCAVAIAGTSIQPTRPREDWTMYDKYIYFSKDLFCMCLFSNAAGFLYCAIFQACRLVGINTKNPDRSLLCLLSFMMGFLWLLISDYLVMEQGTTRASDPYVAIYITLGICCNVIVTSITFYDDDDDDDDYVERKELNKN